MRFDAEGSLLKDFPLTIVLPEVKVLELLAELELAPGAEAAVNLPQQTLTIANGSLKFEIDARLKHRLLRMLVVETIAKIRRKIKRRQEDLRSRAPCQKGVVTLFEG